MKERLQIFKDEKINLEQTICVILLVMVCSGLFGFIYETIFYRIDLGYFVKRGSTFGPWIPIYAYGGLFITIFTYKFRKNPVVVFLLTCIITGLLEYLTGMFFWECFNKRLWDYNIEMWNYGNINGYICLRSVLLFGFSGLFLVYMVIPILKKIITRIPRKIGLVVSYTLSMLFLFDIIVYMIIK